MSEIHVTDVAIIGAGPVGLFGVFQCGMVSLRTHVIDALSEIGGQCTALYPQKPIYDIAGFPEVMAGALIDNLAEQAAPFNPVFHLGQQVTGLEHKDNGRFNLTTSKGTQIDAGAVIIAAGPGAFGPNRPPLKDIYGYEGSAVHYSVRDKSVFTDKDIVITGGGDSAVDWAIELSETAGKIYFAHRRDRFRAAPDSVAKLVALFETGRIEKSVPYQLAALEGDGKNLNAVHLKSMDGDLKTVSAEHLLCFYGLSQDLSVMKEWQLGIERFTIPIDPTTAQTSREGIYAIGDIAEYPNKLKLIATGFAEAAQAAHHAYNYIHPDQALHFEYSTTKGVQGLSKQA